MSKAFEGAKGPWVVSMTPTRVSTPYGEISISWRSNVDESVEIRAEAACRLIAEAGTVLHETGLTPRQLAEQRAELLEALKWAMPMARAGVEMYRMERVKSGHLDIQGTYKNGTTWAGIYQSEVDEIERADAAIANATQQRKGPGA